VTTWHVSMKHEALGHWPRKKAAHGKAAQGRACIDIH